MKYDLKQLIYKPASYEIYVPGKLDASWQDWFDGLTITEVLVEKEIMLSRISGIFDQAGLLGLLRRLNAFGLPILSVICEPFKTHYDIGQEQQLK